MMDDKIKTISLDIGESNYYERKDVVFDGLDWTKEKIEKNTDRVSGYGKVYEVTEIPEDEVVFVERIK